jgi:NADH-quinone oxidoreductase subunit J
MHFSDLFTFLMVLMGAISAGIVAFHPNILYAAVSLVFSLLSVAGLYVVLGADFLAAAQLIIYVGGIIVVILFAIMMSEHIYQHRFAESAKKFVLPFIASVGVLGGLLKLMKGIAGSARVTELPQTPTTEAIGKALVGPYALVFQYVAIVLLAGLIGAVIVARPHHDGGAQQ